MPVPLFDQTTSLAPLRSRVDQRIREVLDRGVYVLGPELHSFERELAARLGVKHVVGVGNGTDAIALALRALGVGPGDDVVVPSFTFYASAEAIALVGARPVFCDIDLETYCVSRETVRAALTARTKAVVAVDLFGNAIPADDLADLGVPVVEDAAQAAGTSYRGRAAGALGHVATFSFYPSKNLPAFGDAGAVATNDDVVAERVRSLRSHGSRDKVMFDRVGTNSRLDEIQAAILRTFLPELDRWCAGRRAAARHYADAGLERAVRVTRPVAGADPAWHLYVVAHERVDALASSLARSGIGHKIYYRTPVHRQPAMREYAGSAHLPATEEAARTHLAIPMSPTLSREDAAEVVGALRRGLA